MLFYSFSSLARPACMWLFPSFLPNLGPSASWHQNDAEEIPRPPPHKQSTSFVSWNCSQNGDGRGSTCYNFLCWLIEVQHSAGRGFLLDIWISKTALYTSHQSIVPQWPRPLILSLTCIYLGFAVPTPRVAPATHPGTDPRLLSSVEWDMAFALSFLQTD